MKKKGSRGIYFTLDALFGIILIGIALNVASIYYISDVKHPQLNYYSSDIANSFSNIKISELNSTYIAYLISNGDIINPNSTILEQIGEFYVLNKTELAVNLSKLATNSLISNKFNYEILVNGETVYKNSSTLQNNELVSSRRMISGIEKFKPLKGATSKVFLEGINNKKQSKYLYFGGFVGQGNITVNLSKITSNANISSVELELDVPGDFTLFINDIQCLGTFTPLSGSTISDRWNLTSCKNLLNEGEENELSLAFDSGLNESYVAGGFLRVDFKTNELSPYFEGYKVRYDFPGVNGIVNLYDAFYVPGTIDSMKMHLHFISNETSYLTVGGKIIHKWQGSEAEQIYDISNDNLSTSSYVNLADDYLLFSNNTVPIRFAAYEEITTTLTGGNADVVLVTDVSGSMKKSTVDWSLGNSAPTCDNYYSNPDTRRTRAAVCLDLEMSDIVMNYSGNRMWPIFIRDNTIINYTWNPSSKQDVDDRISNFYNDQGKDKTCLACAINQGYNLLKAYSNSSRKKFIILMTDGCPTHCALGSCTSNSTVYGSKKCEGLCDTSGACDGTNIDFLCDECTFNDDATDNSIYSAQRAFDDLNITIYTIGFGPMDDCSLANYTLSTIADVTNGTYQHSNNVTKLRDIYRNISYEILEQIDQVSQSITKRGNLTDSIMFSDSYIEINYTPIAQKADYDEIAIDIEEDKFDSCAPSFTVPIGMRVIDAKVVSYSGEHWTQSVTINGKQIFNLSDYYLNYVKLGDPFFVYVPVNNIISGINDLTIMTADSPVNLTGCSFNNTIIYTGLIKSSVSYADVLPNAEGCIWNIEFDDGSQTQLNVPETYTGIKQCYYTDALVDYDMNDSIDSAAYQLFRGLDYDLDGSIYVKFDEFNLKVNAISVRKIPYPWGPAIAELRVWR